MTHEFAIGRDLEPSRAQHCDDQTDGRCSEPDGLSQKLLEGAWTTAFSNWTSGRNWESNLSSVPSQGVNPVLSELESISKTAVLEKGMVLYDVARDALLARSVITNEPTNKDAILRECNRIMVLNGFEDARLDGKSGITSRDLPRSWNGVKSGHQFKLYGEGDIAKFAHGQDQTQKQDQTNEQDQTQLQDQTQQQDQSLSQTDTLAGLLPKGWTWLPVPEEGGELRPPEPEWRPPANGPLSGDPADFFICQFRDNRFNPRGPSSSNDCGPASLAMIAKYYDAQFQVDDKNGQYKVDSSDADPADLVSSVRFLMTGGRDSQELTGLGQIENAAEKMGFDTTSVKTLNELDTVLDSGIMVILSGNPKHYQKDLGLRYGKGGTIYDGGHFVTVVGRQGDDYIVNDPASHRGPLTLTRQQLDDYMRPNDKGLAVFPPGFRQSP